MEVITLQSGSNGNCIYVETSGVRLLFDAGISGVQAEKRLAAHGRDIRNVDALIISHDHSDHTSGMGVFQRKFGIPIHVSKKTLQTTMQKSRIGLIENVEHFRSGSTLHFGQVQVETICTPHDASDSVAFIVDDGVSRLGILTDIGHLYQELEFVMSTLDAVILESNYDPRMLHDGPYPEQLKKRISGSRGHLSNEESAELLASHATPKLKWACLGHLSEHNNHTELVLQSHKQRLGNRLLLHVANRYAASDVMVV